MFPGIAPSGERRLFGDDSGSRPCIGRILRTILYPIVRNDPTFGKKNVNLAGAALPPQPVGKAKCGRRLGRVQAVRWG